MNELIGVNEPLTLWEGPGSVGSELVLKWPSAMPAWSWAQISASSTQHPQENVP